MISMLENDLERKKLVGKTVEPSNEQYASLGVTPEIELTENNALLRMAVRAW
jgi:hypothetical protein